MTDLIELSDYKEYKKISSSERDGKLQALIIQVSELVENYCNRRFKDYVDTAKTEWHDAKTNKVILKEFPVISVTSVKTSTDGGVTQTTLTEADSSGGGYFVDLNDDAIITQKDYVNFLDSYDTPYRSLEIVYKAGYSELPGDLQLAVMDLVHYYESNETKPTQTLLGATVDNPLPYAANSFPPHIRRVLDLYRCSPG